MGTKKDSNVLLLIALDLRHDVEDTVHIKLARFAQLPHTDGLGQRGGTVLALDGFQQIKLFPLVQIGQFHGGGKGDPALVHQGQEGLFKRQKPRLIVQRVFTGEKSMEDVLFPVIYEDLRRQLERRRSQPLWRTYSVRMAFCVPMLALSSRSPSSFKSSFDNLQ